MAAMWSPPVSAVANGVGKEDDESSTQDSTRDASTTQDSTLDESSTQNSTRDSGLSATGSEGSHASVSEEDQMVEEYMFRLPRSYKYEGYIWPGLLMSPARHKELESLVLGEEDVLICSYPKSGTTWVSEIISLLLEGGDIEKVKALPLHQRVPWLEMDNGYVWVRAFWLWQLFAQTVGLKGKEEEKEEHGKRRILFTHLPMELLPPSVLSGPGKLVYIARNPKDQAVSFFHFHQMARFLGQQRGMEWDEWFALYASGNVYCGSWFSHVQAFYQLSKLNPSRLLFLKYEDLKTDLHKEMVKISDFLGVSLGENKLAMAQAHCQFDQMKDNPMANRKGVWLFNQRTSAFMRKGVVGDWTNYFTVAQSNAFDRIYLSRMTDTPDLHFEFLPHEQEKEDLTASLRLINSSTDPISQDQRDVATSP